MLGKKWALFALFIFVGSTLLSACGKTETVFVKGTPQVVEREVEVTRIVEVQKEVQVVVTVTPVPTPPPPSEEPQFGGTLRVAAQFVPQTLDTMGGNANLVTNQVMEHLVDFYEDYSIGPMLAESWEISEDRRTYTFHLRQGVKFHNGKQMTSEDVIASLQRYMDIIGVNAPSFAVMVESYEAPDDYTVVMQLSDPAAAWLGSVVANPRLELVIFPKEIIAGKAPGEVGPEDIIGTGPYYLDAYEPDQYAILKRFEEYQSLPGERLSGLGGTKIAYFDQIRIDFVTDSDARLAGLAAGDYDMIEAPPESEFERFKADPDLQPVFVAPRSGVYIVFNHSALWSSDLNFRQAVLAALEMEPILAAAKDGLKELYALNESIWPPQTSWYWEDDFAKVQYDQNDVGKAQSLLQETGYDGQEIVIATTRTYEYMYRAMLSVADQLQSKLGMRVKIELYDWMGLVGKWAEEDTWQISVTANNSLQLTSPEGAYFNMGCESAHPVNARYCNPEMEAAFGALVASATQEERLQNLRPILRIFWEDLPNIKVGELYDLQATRSDIRGYVGWGKGTRFYGVWRVGDSTAR